jgi:3D (Asp-Asp-Asp) domain-containing protein
MVKNMNIKIFKKMAFWSQRDSLIASIFAGIIVGICLLGLVIPQTSTADFEKNTYASYVARVSNEAAQKNVRKIKVVLTAYSSTPDQTWGDPFITASGKRVADGIVANNMLPFGTEIRIPELYGDKIFVVQDRMHRRKSGYQIDIWFPERQLAVEFGVKTAEIEILEN